MKIRKVEKMDQIIYYSRGGNTRKVAEAIAEELQVNATNVNNASIGEIDNEMVLFLGSGNYGGRPGSKIIEFIKKNDFSNMQVALFGTSGGGKGNELKLMEEIIELNGATVKGKFYCKGKTFGLINRRNPTAEELNEAKSFAQKMVEKN